jgi:hypothetical protein
MLICEFELFAQDSPIGKLKVTIETTSAAVFSGTAKCIIYDSRHKPLPAYLPPGKVNGEDFPNNSGIVLRKI